MIFLQSWKQNITKMILMSLIGQQHSRVGIWLLLYCYLTMAIVSILQLKMELFLLCAEKVSGWKSSGESANSVFDLSAEDRSLHPFTDRQLTFIFLLTSLPFHPHFTLTSAEPILKMPVLLSCVEAPELILNYSFSFVSPPQKVRQRIMSLFIVCVLDDVCRAFYKWSMV